MTTKLFLMILSLFLIAQGCTRQSPSNSTSKTVNLAIWGNYLSPEQAAAFSKETGIELKITNFSSNEELLAKLQSGSSGLDLAVPSDYMVEILAQLGLLQPLERSEISNWGDLDPSFLNQSFDPQNRFSLPYAWTVTGLAIHRICFQEISQGGQTSLKTKI